MKPRDWMRLIVPGFCVGLLPACFNPAMNAPKNRPFTGQNVPNYGQPQAPPYAMQPAPSYPWKSSWYQQPGPMLTMYPIGPAFDPSFQFQQFPYIQPPTAYNRIDYGPVANYPRHILEPNFAAQPTPTQQAVAKLDTGVTSVLPSGDLLQLTVNNQPSSDSQSGVGPFELPGAAGQEPAAPGKLPPTLIEESPIVDAVKSSVEKRPDGIRDALNSLDPARREILMTLIPLAVRVGEGGLASTDPHDVAVVVDQLQGLLWALRPRAALVMDKFCFCQRIEKFGKFKPLPAKPSFRPGEMVEVYAEFRNISSQPHRTEQGDFRTQLRGKLEIRNSAGGVLLTKECNGLDETLTPQHDYFQHYRLRIPDARPGSYVLNLEAEDVPTGRKVKQKLEFQVIDRE